MESMWKNMGTNSSWNARIDDTIVVDSIVMTTCMSPFSKPLLDFNLMRTFSIFINMPFCKCCSCISIWGDFTLKVIVVKATLSNKSQCKYEQHPLYQKRKNLPKWIWQQTNEVTFCKANSCKSTHLAKHTFVET